jgi:hypothetical protein
MGNTMQQNTRFASRLRLYATIHCCVYLLNLALLHFLTRGSLHEFEGLKPRVSKAKKNEKMRQPWWRLLVNNDLVMIVSQQ